MHFWLTSFLFDCFESCLTLGDLGINLLVIIALSLNLMEQVGKLKRKLDTFWIKFIFVWLILLSSQVIVAVFLLSLNHSCIFIFASTDSVKHMLNILSCILFLKHWDLAAYFCIIGNLHLFTCYTTSNFMFARPQCTKIILMVVSGL